LFDKVLVPLDGSKLAAKALPYAEEMAIEFGSKITLLSAGAPEDTPQHDEYLAYLKKTSATVSAEIKKIINKAEVKTAITGKKGIVNDAAAEILDYAAKDDDNMIIMATHGRTGLTRWVLGDVANKVARAFSCPLLMIRAKATTPKSVHIKKILVPLDGSAGSEAVLPFVEAFAETIKPEITLLHIVDLQYHVYAYPEAAAYGGANIVRVPYNKTEMKPFVDAGKKYIQSISDKLAEKGFANKVEVRSGSAGEEIMEAEAKIKPDLVIMSTHGHSGFGRFEHGSVTDKVLHGGASPLLLIRPPQTAGKK
jgi:nucleotide-binding universal stress UspA family protein